MTELFIQPLYDWRSAISSDYGPDSPTTRLVLLTLALYMSPKGDNCFPSQETLARNTKLTRRAVVKHLGRAERAGWIAKRERERTPLGWRRVEYFAMIPAGVEARVREADEKKRGERRAPRKPGERRSKPGERGGSKVVHQVHMSIPVNYPAAAATETATTYPQGKPANPQNHPQDKSQSAAAAGSGKLIYPERLSSAQQESIDTYLRGLSPTRAQQILDELSGLMKAKSVRDPMALFAHLARQNDDGRLVCSHAHRVQVEREGAALQAELEDRGR